MANPFTIDRGTALEFGVFIIFSRDGSARMTRKPTKLGRDERGMSLAVRIPKSIFDTPQLRATIAVSDEVEQVAIDIAAAAEALRGAIGCDVDIKVNEPATEAGQC